MRIKFKHPFHNLIIHSQTGCHLYTIIIINGTLSEKKYNYETGIKASLD